jgi:uncharacterized protein DUF3352
MRASRLVALAAVMLATVAGCGGEETLTGSVPDGASFAPANTAAYVFSVTDVESEQWAKADALLKRFPGRAELLESFNEELEQDDLTWERDVRPALGEDVHVVWLDFGNGGENIVGYTKPRDKAKLNALLECCDEPMVHREIDGWTVFAEEQALIDRFARARSGDSLADDDVFRDAMERLPDDSLARAYVSGQQIEAAIEREAAKDPDVRAFRELQKSLGTIESLSFAATARDEGVRMDAAFAGNRDPQVDSFEAALDERLPAGALAYVSFGDLRDFWRGFLDSAKQSIPNFEQQRRQFETALGFSLEDDLFPLFKQEGAVALYRSSSEIPGVTFLLDVEGEEEKARNVVTRLGALVQLGDQGAMRKLTIEGVEVTQLSFPGETFSVFLGVSEGTLIVSTTEAGFREALGAETPLADDEVFEQAREAAELPDDSIGFLYVNLNVALDFFLDMAPEGEIDPQVRPNVEPLESALLYGQRDGNRVLLSGFLTIK